eukprot:6456697-Amphidinium_carterae.1
MSHRSGFKWGDTGVSCVTASDFLTYTCSGLGSDATQPPHQKRQAVDYESPHRKIISHRVGSRDF